MIKESPQLSFEFF